MGVMSGGNTAAADLENSTRQLNEQLQDKGFLVTFGVSPTNPETGFGYIEASENINYETVKGSKIKRFIEKPDLEKAKKLIKDNRFFWNSGMF
ncbi:MAG: hypothetical protein CML62_02905, partial [Rhodobacteraceae bacterium]|nr:hypothetical protein [Paracoccaceae bacterium]